VAQEEELRAIDVPACSSVEELERWLDAVETVIKRWLRRVPGWILPKRTGKASMSSTGSATRGLSAK